MSKLSEAEQNAIDAFKAKKAITQCREGSAMQQEEKRKAYYQAIGQLIGGPSVPKGKRSCLQSTMQNSTMVKQHNLADCFDRKKDKD